MTAWFWCLLAAAVFFVMLAMGVAKIGGLALAREDRDLDRKCEKVFFLLICAAVGCCTGAALALGVTVVRILDMIFHQMILR